MVYFNNNNKVGISVNSVKDDVLNHIYVVFFLFGAFIFLTIYILYRYFIGDNIRSGYTYYASDITKLNPLFTETTENVKECVNICKEQLKCDGITYNEHSNVCIGQHEGVLRTDKDHLISWVKTKDYSKILSKGLVEEPKQGIILHSNIKSSSRLIIPNKKIGIPPIMENYSYTFWLYVDDWYDNYSYWRHIFHKGSSIDKDVNKKLKTLEYRDWEQIMTDLPEQNLGVLISPFQNTLRICLTTISQIPSPRIANHANTQKCKCNPFKNTNTNDVHCSNCWITDQEGDLDNIEDSLTDTRDYQSIEYIDIQDLQTGMATHIAISLKGDIIEVYINGIFRASKVLTGRLKWNNGDLYIHNPLTYSGEMKNLTYFQGSLNGEIINKLFKKKF